MGYETKFKGILKLNKKLDCETYKLLVQLSETRRVKRSIEELKKMGYSDDYGKEGEFFVEGNRYSNYQSDKSILDANVPPSTQPSLWCNWTPSKDKLSIKCNKHPNFYAADKWLEYIIEKILIPKEYVLNGEISAQGEYSFDKYILKVDNNKVKKIELCEY